MAKWADFLISAVRYDKDKKHIFKVKKHEDKGDNVGSAETVARTVVVSELKKGYTYMTIYKGDEGKWKKGEDVRIITVNNKEYIRTDANEKEADNLGNLPEF